MITDHSWKIFFTGKIQNTLYSSPDYECIFRKWPHLQSSSDCNTWSCVISLSFKKMTSFLVRSPFHRVGIISSCMRRSEPQRVFLFTERSVCNEIYTNLLFFLSEEISFLKAAINLFPKTNDFCLLFFWHISLTKNSFELIYFFFGN